MPVNQKIMKNLTKEYGEKKGKQVYYSMENSNKIPGVHKDDKDNNGRPDKINKEKNGSYREAPSESKWYRKPKGDKMEEKEEDKEEEKHKDKETKHDKEVHHEDGERALKDKEEKDDDEDKDYKSEYHKLRKERDGREEKEHNKKIMERHEIPEEHHDDLHEILKGDVSDDKIRKLKDIFKDRKENDEDEKEKESKEHDTKKYGVLI